MSTRTRGACLCGAVTFAIAPPYRWFAHCHCSLCRKHHGSLFSSGIGVARDRLEWLVGGDPWKSPKGGDPWKSPKGGDPWKSPKGGGPDDVVHYRATAAFERPFCRHCGSTVPAISHDERFWHVPAGLLDESLSARPRSHIFVGSKSPLYELADSLPRHAAYPPGMELPALERRSASAKPGTIVGSCVCDGIAFAAAIPRRLVNCYCSLCRRRSGGAFTSTLLAAAESFSWLRGEARIRHYSLPATIGPRGAPHQYGADFCCDCGSPVPSVVAATAMLPAGAIDDPWKSPKGDTDLPPLPAVHLYVGSKAPWVSITDSWPQFDELPPPAQLKDWFQ